MRTLSCSKLFVLSFAAVASLTSESRSQNLYSLYGSGCPSGDETRPVIGPLSPPVVGNPRFGVFASALPDDAPAVLLFALSVTDIPLGGSDCRLHVGPTGIFMLPMLSDGRNDAHVNLPLPEEALLAGITVYFQAVGLLPGNLRLSPGMQVTFSEAHREYGTVSLLHGSPGALSCTYFDRTGSHGEGSLPGTVSLLPIGLSGFQEAASFLTDHGDRRVQLHLENPQAPYIGLQDVGRLYRVLDNVSGEIGFVVAKNDAALVMPVLSSGLGTGANYESTVAVRGDGRVFVATMTVGALRGSFDRLILASTDGSLLEDMSISRDITPSRPVRVITSSKVFCGDRFLFTALDLITGDTLLFDAPADGSAPAQIRPLPPLSNGALPRFVQEDILVSRAGVATLVAGDGILSDVYALDTTTHQALNVSRFPLGVAVESFGSSSSGKPFRGALSGSGAQVFFTAIVFGSREAFLAPTDGTLAGELLGGELSRDSIIPPHFQELRDPRFSQDLDLLFFAGPSSNSLDLLHYRIDPNDTREILAIENVTATSGETQPPFFNPGTIQVGASFVNEKAIALYFERQLPFTNTFDLVGVDLAVFAVYNITGKEFSPSPVPSYRRLRSLSYSGVEVLGQPWQQRAMLVTESTEGSTLARLDLGRPDVPPIILESTPPGTTIDDVIFTRDAERSAYVISTPSSCAISVHTWSNASTQDVRLLAGQITNGSLRFVNEGDDTLIYAVGTNDPIQPTDAVLEHLSTRTLMVEVVYTQPESITVMTTTTTPTTTTLGCTWSGDVDVTCFCVDKQSYMIVTINANPPTDELITVWIEGDGPSFLDGTKTKTVPCKTGTTKFEIKANNKPGCYAVCLNNIILKDRIRVIKATATFRNAGTVSGDNDFPAEGGCNDSDLGEGTDYYGGNAKTNTMELCYALEPKDACKCEFDIRRTKDVKEYSNGALTSARSGNDDASNADEDLTPSSTGSIYSVDAPGIGNVAGGANGDTKEYHGHFTEWLEIKNKGALERCSEDLEWESHLYVENNGGTWQVDNTKSDVSTGHDKGLGADGC